MSFRRFLIKRTVIAALLTLIAVSVIFATLRLLPADPFSALVASGSLTPEEVEQVRAMYGLDEPIHVQYFNYIRNLFSFKFGISLTQQRAVSEIIVPALMNTLVLLLPALVTTAIVSSLAGMYAGWTRGSAALRTGRLPEGAPAGHGGGADRHRECPPATPEANKMPGTRTNEPLRPAKSGWPGGGQQAVVPIRRSRQHRIADKDSSVPTSPAPARFRRRAPGRFPA
jgi:hypothetical protein